MRILSFNLVLQKWALDLNFGRNVQLIEKLDLFFSIESYYKNLVYHGDL